MKHTIEKVDENHYKLDDTIDIKYVEQFGNDNGWCVVDKDYFYQIIYNKFENALLTAMGEANKNPKVLTPPVGIGDDYG